MIILDFYEFYAYCNNTYIIQYHKVYLASFIKNTKVFFGDFFLDSYTYRLPGCVMFKCKIVRSFLHTLEYIYIIYLHGYTAYQMYYMIYIYI